MGLQELDGPFNLGGYLVTVNTPNLLRRPLIYNLECLLAHGVSRGVHSRAVRTSRLTVWASKHSSARG